MIARFRFPITEFVLDKQFDFGQPLNAFVKVTPGEIKARSGRLYTFEEYDEVKTVLDGLIDRDCGPVVARLARKAGRKDHEYMHLFGGEIASAPEDTTMTERSSSSIHKEDRFTQLEARVSSLEHALQNLAQRLGEEISLGEEVSLDEIIHDD